MFKFILTEYFLAKHTDQRPDKMLIPGRGKLVLSNKTYKNTEKNAVLYLEIGWIILW